MTGNCLCCPGCPPLCTTCPEILTVSFTAPFGGVCACANVGLITVRRIGNTCSWIKDPQNQPNGCIGSDCACDLDLQEFPPFDCVECGLADFADCRQNCAEGLQHQADVEDTPDTPRGWSASIDCEFNEWIVRVSTGTVSICPKISLSGLGKRPADRRRNKCPSGIYETIWGIECGCLNTCCGMDFPHTDIPGTLTVS